MVVGGILTNQKEGRGKGSGRKVWVGGILHHLLKMEPIQRSETSVFNNNKTPEEYPKELLSSINLIFTRIIFLSSNVAGSKKRL